MDILTRAVDDFSHDGFVAEARKFYLTVLSSIIKNYAYTPIRPPEGAHAYSFTTAGDAVKSLVQRLDKAFSAFADTVGGSEYNPLQRLKLANVVEYTPASGTTIFTSYRGFFALNEFVDVRLCVTVVYLGVEGGDASVSVNLVVEDAPY